MVPAVLRVVLVDEDRRARPETALRERFDQPPDREVVVGDVRAGRGRVLVEARGVVLRQVDDREVRELAALLHRTELVEEAIDAQLVRDGHVPAGILRGGVARERLGRDVARAPEAPRAHGRLHVEPGALGLVDAREVELPEVAERQSAQQHRVPEEAVGRIGQRIGAEVVAARPAAELLLEVVDDDALHGPLVAVGRHDAVAVVVVEQHEALGQRVLVGRHLAPEDAQARVAVGLREVAEDLVVGAVLLEHVDDVLDRRGFANLAWHRPRPHARSRARRRRALRLRHARVAQRTFGPLRERRRVEARDARERAALVRRVPALVRFLPRARTLALHVGHEEPLALHGDRARKSAGRDEARERTRPGGRKAHDGQRVVASVRHVERALVGRERERVRDAPEGQRGIRPHADALEDTPLARVDHEDRVRVRRSHVQAQTVARELEIAGVQAAGDLGRARARLEIDHADRAARADTALVDHERRARTRRALVGRHGPPTAEVRDVGAAPVGGERHVIGRDSDRDRRRDLSAAQVDLRERVAAREAHERRRLVRGERHAAGIGIAADLRLWQRQRARGRKAPVRRDRELEELILRACEVELVARARERETVHRAAELLRAVAAEKRHAPRVEREHAALLLDEHEASVGREHEIERPAVESERRARGLDHLARRQHVAALRSRPDGRVALRQLRRRAGERKQDQGRERELDHGLGSSASSGCSPALFSSFNTSPACVTAPGVVSSTKPPFAR